MLGATVIAVFFIPMFYYVIESMSEKFGGKKPAPAGGAVPAGAHAKRQGRLSAQPLAMNADDPGRES